MIHFVNIFTFAKKIVMNIYNFRAYFVLSYRLLVWCGMSKPLLKDRALEARDRGLPLTLSLHPVLARMRKEDEKIRYECRGVTVLGIRILSIG